MKTTAHDDCIIDQFTKQAIPFAEAHAHLDEIDTILALSGVGIEDDMLDVACGPGLVACAFAKVARSVTGIDITAKMIEQARELQRERGLANIRWNVGTALPLPFGDASFSCVVTRYTFHHFLDAPAVFREMLRVCRPGGTVLVADVAPPAEKGGAFDAIEKLRDPSHTRALPADELEALFADSGLTDLRKAAYPVGFKVEDLLARSFPNPGEGDEFRRRVRADLGVDALGFNAHEENGELRVDFPIRVYAGRKQA